MEKFLSIILLILLIYYIGNIDGIRCYNCLDNCFDPFNKTNSKAIPMESPSGWCMKFKTSSTHELVLLRSSAPPSLCTEKKCKTIHRHEVTEIGCCCNTELCNNSNRMKILLMSTINGVTCTCCFHATVEQCQTPDIHYPSCTFCDASFCPNHVKGCQGGQCKTICNDDSSSTTTTTPKSSTSTEPITTPPQSSSSVEPIATTTFNAGSIVRNGLLMISACFTMLTLIQLNV